MSFFQNVKSAVYNPSFYAKIKNQPLGVSLKYFFLLALILALTNTFILSYELGVKIPQGIKEFIAKTANAFPQDMVITIDNGQVLTNVGEPYFVPFPQFEKEVTQESLNNILVIDTKTSFSAAQFGQYKTLFWLTRDSLFYQNREFDTRSIDLSKFDNIKVDKSFVQNMFDKINPYLNLIGPILVLVVFIGLFIGFAFNLIYFFLLALLIFLLSNIFKWGLNYWASFKVSIYSSTLAFIIDLILFNTGIYSGFYGFPFLFTLISLCVATINLQNTNKSS